MLADNCINKIQELQNSIDGIIVRNLKVKDTDIYILYIPQITNRDGMSDNIIKPLLQYNKEQPLTADLIVKSIIYIDDTFYEEDETKLTDHIIDGKSVILIAGSSQYIVANTAKIEKRAVQSPEVESSIRAPKDAFNENIDSNLSLIRYRLKDPTLKVDYFKIGKRTKTTVAVLYMQDLANSNYVTEIEKKLQEIDVEGILESGYIQKLISNKNNRLFPQIGISERSDSACANILEGKVCILVDGSNLALIGPKGFIEFFDAADDHYDNIFIGIFQKVLRWIALISSLTLSALYVAIVAFHPEIIPSQYILIIANSRVAVPVNALTEATIMEVIVELLREANIRLPKKIGPSISIVGTIVIGQAAVFAGLVSPLMVIIISLSSIASFAVSDYTIMNPIRLLKFVMIFFTGFFGLYGFMAGLTIILIKITSMTSVGVPYTEKISPFDYRGIKKYFLNNLVFGKKKQ